MKEYQHSGTGKPWLQSQPRLRSIQVISAATLGKRLPWIEFHRFGFQQREGGVVEVFPADDNLGHLDSKDLMLLMLLLWWMSLVPKTNEVPGKTI